MTLVAIAVALLAACDPTSAPTDGTPGAAIATTAPTVQPTPRPTVRPTPSPTPSPTATPTASPAASPEAAVDTLTTPCPGNAPSDTKAGKSASVQSRNWSGYVATGATTFSCVEAVWTQPKVRCRGSAQQAAVYWVGLGGYDHHSLVQIGTESACVGGVAQAAAWHESLPRETYALRANLRIRVGDRIWAQVRSLGNGRYRMSLVNLTTRKRVAIPIVNTTLKRTSAEWIVEAPTGGCPQACHTLRMPDFKTFAFEEAWLSLAGARRPLVGARFVHAAESMVAADGLVRSEVTSTGQDGTSFMVRWRRQ